MTTQPNSPAPLSESGKRIFRHILMLLAILLLVMMTSFGLLLNGIREQRDDLELLHMLTYQQTQLEDFIRLSYSKLFEFHLFFNKAESPLTRDYQKAKETIEANLKAFSENRAVTLQQDGEQLTLQPGDYEEIVQYLPQLYAEWTTLKNFVDLINTQSDISLKNAAELRKKAANLMRSQYHLQHTITDDLIYDERLIIFYQRLMWILNIAWLGFMGWYAFLYIAKPLSQTTQQLEGARQHLQTILDNVLDCIVVIDPQGLIQSCNLETEKLFHYTSEELVGQNISMLMPEPHRSRHDAHIANYLVSGMPKIIGNLRELTSVDKNGRVFPIELGIAEIRRGKERLFVGMIRDISERKRMTEKLKRHQEELQQLVEERTQSLQKETARLKRMENLALEKQHFLDTVIDNIPLGIFVKNAKENYRWVLWNRASEKLFEMSASDVLGKFDYDFFPKEEADFFRATDINVMKSGSVVIPYENVTTKRGTWVARTIKVPIYDENGQPYLLLGILEDITEANEKEARLKDYAQKLEHQQNSLIEAKRAAEKANALKSEFLANMSHELRTPMHSIITFSRQGVERIYKWTPEEQAENLGLIKESGERLLRLINDLLDISKLEAGKVDFTFVEYKLQTLLQNAQLELQGLIDEKHLRLNTTYASDVPSIQCDRDKILQMIINLLSNAIKFSPAGKCIHIHLRASAEQVCLEIEDEGVGIPDDELDQVFDKFIQSSKTKTGAGGTGLGLAICREITEAHKGVISARNNRFGGATFEVILPISQS